MKRTLLLTLTALASTVLALGLGALVLKATGHYPAREIWILRQRVFGLEKVGIWQDDPRLGWRHLPNSVGQHRTVPDFEVQYRIDDQGHRSSPASYALPKLLVLGGSYTFGHGVENSETFSARLESALPDYKVLNAAVNGWGTGQSLLKLEEALERYDDIALVIYGYIDHHRQRNYLRKDWLSHIAATRNRRLPYFSLQGQRPVFRGLADPVRDGIPESTELEEAEARMTAALLREMGARAAERSIPFLLVFLPDGTPRLLASWVEQAVGKEHFLDLRPLDPFQRHRFDNDLHPNAKGHLIVAEALIPPLKQLLTHDTLR